VQAAWDNARSMQQAACGLVRTHTHDGVRLSGLKLLESTILLFTDGTAPPVPGA